MPFAVIVRKTLLATFAKLNKKYGSRGLDFYVGEDHYWIEIRIDTNKAAAYRKATNYDPNVREEGDEDDELEDEGIENNDENG